MAAYALIQLATWLTRVLPIRSQRWLADGFAAIAWRILPAMHGRVRANVRTVLGPEAEQAEVERVAREQWRNYLRYMRDFAALPHEGAEAMSLIYDAADGWEHVEQALARGRGMVLVSVHFGNWDLAAGAVAQLHPVNAIADTFSSARVDRAINLRREALGLRIIPIEKAVKRTMSAFKRNEIVAFLVDKPLPGDDGVEVEFFGQPTRIPAGAAFFAARVGAPLLMGFAWRTPDGSFTGHILPPIEVSPDVRVTTQRMMSQAEEQIRAHPEHWYMFRNMWDSGSRSQEARSERDELLTTSFSRPTTSKGEAVA